MNRNHLNRRPGRETWLKKLEAFRAEVERHGNSCRIRPVSKWLEQRMFAKVPSPKQLADQTAAYFNHASLHKSHGRRIDRIEARANSVVTEDLEANQDLQEWVLTSYHLMTILFEKSPSSKVLISNQNKLWVKNANVVRMPNGRIPVAQIVRAIERKP